MTRHSTQKHCIECGKLLAESAKFCWSCGSEIQSAAPKPAIAPAEPVRRKKLGYGVVALVVAVVGLVALSVSPTALRDFVQTAVSSRSTDDRSAVRVEPEGISDVHARAEAGDVTAQALLVERQMADFGVSREDEPSAQLLYWASSATERLNQDTQYELGQFYSNRNLSLLGGLPHNRPEDDEAAVRWFQLAAEQGHSLSMYYLGELYVSGKGVPVDYVQAFIWINLAVSRMSGPMRDSAVRRLGMLSDQLTPTQRGQAEFLRSQWEEISLRR